MDSIVYYRNLDEAQGEFDWLRASGLPATPYISDLAAGQTVVQRYTTLPMAQFVHEELDHLGAKSVNSLTMHKYTADCLAWAADLGELTPETWDNWAMLDEGAYVVKGRTNSRKFKWNTHMFAATRRDVPTVAGRLLDDSLISGQGLVVRRYVPLAQLATGINDMPVSNEWRSFWLMVDGTPVMLATGPYWTSHPEILEAARWDDVAYNVATKAAAIVGRRVNFFVLDLAETADGDWIVVEVNDGQMSGLCGVEPAEMYSNLFKHLGA